MAESEPIRDTSSDNPKPLSSAERLDKALGSLESNVGLDQTLDVAGIELSDVHGRVLDIGSGSLDRLARELGEEGFEVVSVDPKLIFWQRRESVIAGDDGESSHSLPWQQRSVAGLAQELPLKNDSFDTIFAAASMSYIDPADYPVTLSEIHRVLAPGGKAYILPLLEVPNTPYCEAAFLKALAESGIQYIVKNEKRSELAKEFKVVTIEKPA